MAKQKLSIDEATSLAAALSKMRQDSAEAQVELEKMFASSQKITRQLEKDFKKFQVQSLKDIDKKKKEILKLYNRYDELAAAQKKYLKVLEDEVKEEEKARGAVLKLTTAKQEQEKAEKNVTKSLKAQINELKNNNVAIIALNTVISGLVSLYRTWAGLQQKTTEAMGRATQQLGGSERVMQGFQRRMEGMRDTFSHLEGDIDGIALSAQHLAEVSLALRRNTDSLGRGVEMAMLRTARGFGIGNENAAQLFRVLETGVAGANTNLDEFGARMINFAESIGGNASQLVTDFVDARSAVAQFGSEGEQVFRNAAMMANEFGFETRRIFDMMRGFDTFQQASQNVNQLNAMLGTSLSSFEMMMEQDPTERLEMLRRELMASGQDWNSMSRQARQALSQITGESEDVLARVFGEGRSLDQIRAEQQRAEADQRRRDQRQQSAQDVMLSLLERTSFVWDNMGRIIERIRQDIAEYLSPLLEVIHEETNGLLISFRDWLRQMQNSGQAQEFIRNIANWIRQAAEWIRNVNWEQVWQRTQQTWREWAPIVRQIGGIILDVLRFAAEHPGVVAAALGGAMLLRFVGGLQTAATLMSGMAGSAGVISSILGGAAIPLASIAGSYALARGAEDARVAEGQRSTTDRALQHRLSLTAMEELERRGQLARSGEWQRATTGRTREQNLGGFGRAWQQTVGRTREAVGAVASEHLGFQSSPLLREMGFMSGQEADQARGDAAMLLDNIIRGSSASTSELARQIRARAPEPLIRSATGGLGLEEYIQQRRQQVSALSATESSTATQPTQSATPPSPSSGQRTQPVHVTVEANMRELGNAIAEVPMR